MKKVVLLLAVTLTMTGTAFAKEDHAHGGHHSDKQMAKLHKMMPNYAKGQTKIAAALEGGDLQAVLKETDYLLSTTADLKKSKPHKKASELEEFRKLAAGFEMDVKETAETARKGDVPGAKASFAEAQKKCTACHAMFRN
ncbi:MAG TPA: cytochrome C [Geobacter sp.]|nr:cytochrome C [Geobacter sp.]